MIITTPSASFVDFNGEDIDFNGTDISLPLPVYNTFAGKFQFSILDELLPSDSVFYAAICNSNCETIYDPNYAVLHMCARYVLNIAGVPLIDSDFPLIVNSYTPETYQPQIAPGVYTRDALLTALSDAYELNVPGYDFIHCCQDEVPLISGISVTRASGGGPVELELSSYFSNAYVDFPATVMSPYVDVEECFRYCILDEAKQVIGCSNLFKRIYDPKFTTVFTYYNEENGNGFKYVMLPGSVFSENQIRLPVYFNKPTFEVEENIFRQSNKIQKRLSTNIQRVFVGNVGYLSDDQHLKMIVLLKSDYLHVSHQRKNIDRRMMQVGDYTPEYPEINDYVASPASFPINDFMNTYVNNNCGFECGVEVLDDCTTSISPGGNTSKYHIEFSVPSASMGVGDTTYTNGNFIGASDVEVYREGLIQYKTGDNYYSFDPTTGTITVFPAASSPERFSIWAV